VPFGELKGAWGRLKELLPSLGLAHCQEDDPGSVCGAITAQTPLAQVVCRTALELQHLAGMDTLYGTVEPAKEPRTFRLIYSYSLEHAGVFAAEAALTILKAVIARRSVRRKLDEALTHIRGIYEAESIGPSTQSIIDEAEKRGIPAMRLDAESSLIQLGQGCHGKLFRATVMDTTSSIAVDTVSSKPTTKKLLSGNGIPVPLGVVVHNRKELLEQLPLLEFPLVIKPVDGNHGRGITANITTREGALKAYRLARAVSDDVIVENYIEGDDYRFLVINYKLIAAAKRTPAMVVGDGISTIRELVDRVNADPDRGTGHEKVLTTIRLDAHTATVLREQGLTVSSVVPEGRKVMLKKTANLSTGGTATDVTDTVHPSNAFMAERIARLVHLDVCGIDIMAKDVTVPLAPGNGAVIEVNAGPGFRMHTHPSHGQPRNVAKPVVDMLFPDGQTGRIPVVAVTGTNGKTTVVRLIAHIATHAGKMTGYTTTEGVYIGGRVILKGDCSGPSSARVVLGDPYVDYAVLECARGGILRSGLAFDRCDISIVTNVTEDHLGIDEIETLEEYARVKEVVPKSTSGDGHAILNADDPRVYAMKNGLQCNVVLFSAEEGNEAVAEHCRNGGAAVMIENGSYILCEGGRKTVVTEITEIPLTFGGTAGHMVKNILPAIAAAWFSGFSAEQIREALLSFRPSAETTPGRMNLFDFGDFKLMLDYAHNEAGFLEIERYMSTVKATHKVCIVGGTGDRRDKDIRNIGTFAARTFDEIIIREDTDTRGRAPAEMTGLISEGVRSVDPDKTIHAIPDEYEAIGFAVRRAEPGSFIFVCADHVWDSIEMIRDYHGKYGKKKKEKNK
jgi:cyanophycin synthetase